MQPVKGISVITPSFNQAPFLDKCILSVKRMGPKVIEHIILDPGSTDGSLEIARSYKHLTLINEKDSGQSDAINKGFGLAKGEIVGWLNSDDEYCDGILEDVLNRFNQLDCPDIVYGKGHFVDENGGFLREAYVNPKPESLKESFKKSVGILQPSLFFRRSSLQKLGFLDQGLNYCMDYEFWIRASKLNFKFAYLNKNLSLARYYPNNKTLGERGKSLDETSRMCKSQYGFVHKFWIESLAQFNLYGKDGILNNVTKESSGDIKEEMRKIAKLFNSDEECFKLLQSANLGTPEYETFLFMKNLQISPYAEATNVKEPSLLLKLVFGLKSPRSLLRRILCRS